MASDLETRCFFWKENNTFLFSPSFWEAFAVDLKTFSFPPSFCLYFFPPWTIYAHSLHLLKAKALSWS